MNNTQLKYGVPFTKVADFLVLQKKRIFAKSLNIKLSTIMDPSIIAVKSIFGSYFSRLTNFEFEDSSMVVNKTSNRMVLICKHKMTEESNEEEGLQSQSQTRMEITMNKIIGIKKITVAGKDYLQIDRDGNTLILGFQQDAEFGLENMEKKLKEIMQNVNPSNLDDNGADDGSGGSGSESLEESTFNDSGVPKRHSDNSTDDDVEDGGGDGDGNGDGENVDNGGVL